MSDASAPVTTLDKYSNYKDSNQSWLGHVPSHWELRRLGSQFWERREKVSDKDFEPLSVTKKGIFPQLETAAKTNDGDNRKLVIAGDFVINSRSDRKGSSGVADRDGSVSLINTVLRPEGFDASYCNHLLKSYNFIEEFYRMGRGIVADLWTTRYDEMANIILAIPPLQEQKAIAAFLDEKTAKIDQAIQIKEQQIALLKERKQIIIQQAVTRGLNPDAPMKDSGIDWIGEIPAHWNIKRLKNGVSIRGGFAFQSSDFVDEGVQLLKIANVYQNRLALERQPTFLPEKYLSSHADWVVKSGDILMSLTGTLGKRDYGFAVLLDTEDKFLLNQRVARLSVQKFFNTGFLVNFLQSDSYLNQIYQLPAGTKQANLSNEHVVNSYIPVPPKKEQGCILGFTHKTNSSINRMIKIKHAQIETLKEYKTTLINEAVTGKIKVA